MAESTEPSDQSQIWTDDDQRDETDSTIGTETSSITQSLSSSVMDYQYEHGRRYHAYEAGKYHMPNDEQEADRLDLQHQLWLMGLEGKLFLAPIQPGITNAVDIGTGTGIWAIDLADQFPDCQVIGTDLSPIQPGWVPPNCSFLVDDADGDREWEFPPMDFVHSRLIIFGLKNWARYFDRCFAALKPGGWVEVHEYALGMACDDGSCAEDDPCFEWINRVAECVGKIGGDKDAVDNFEGYLTKSGFTNINRTVLKWPVGPWREEDPRYKRMGEYMRLNLMEGLNSTKAFFTRVLGWSNEEAEVFGAKCRAAYNDGTKHRYVPVNIHYAQKPLDSPAPATTESESMLQAEKKKTPSPKISPATTEGVLDKSPAQLESDVKSTEITSSTAPESVEQPKLDETAASTATVEKKTESES